MKPPEIWNLNVLLESDCGVQIESPGKGEEITLPGRNLASCAETTTDPQGVGHHAIVV